MTFIARWRQDDYPATDEVQCVSIYIPAGDEFKAVLAALLALPTSIESYEEPNSAQADGLAAVWDEAYSRNNWDGCGIPPECIDVNTQISLWPANMPVNTGNAVTAAIDTLQRNNGQAFQNPATNAQILESTNYLAGGTWDYVFTVVKQAASGILRLQVNDPSGTPQYYDHDLYSAATQRNVRVTGTFTVSESGQVRIFFIANGKNAASSGYSLLITIFEAWKQ